MVDDQDYELLSKYKWYEAKGRYTSYANTSVIIDGKRKTLSMHRMLLQPESYLVVDHKDGNGLNNQRDNIWICTLSQNGRNRKPRQSKRRNITGPEVLDKLKLDSVWKKGTRNYNKDFINKKSSEIQSEKLM